MRLIVLIAVFSLLCGGFFIFYNSVPYAIAGRLALAAVFLFSGINHVFYKEGIYLTYPNFLSQTNRIKIVFVMGDLQFFFAAALVFAYTANIVILTILAYLIFGFYTQVNACIKHVSVKRGNYTGRGLPYLFFKIPEQLIVIAWAYYFVLCF